MSDRKVSQDKPAEHTCEATDYHGDTENLSGKVNPDKTERCSEAAVGRYRIEGRHGGESENWLCELHRAQYDASDSIAEVLVEP